MTFFLAMAEDPSWIPAGLTTTADAVEHMLKLGGALGFAYVIMTGLAHRAGTRRGQSIAEHRRLMAGKPNLKAFPEESAVKPFWKDDALLQGGLNGIFVMAILFSYVIIMLAAMRPALSMLPRGISILMIYPNTMAVLAIAPWAIMLRKTKIAPLYLLVGLSVAAAVFSFIIQRAESTATAFVIQMLIFAFQSSTISYVVGLGRGISVASLEERYPLVAVTSLNGQVRSDLRLIKVSPSDCRFMETDGSVTLIPKSRIASIRTL